MKVNYFATTLIVSTYNWPEALRLCLDSVSRQSVLPNEVIVADDGSTDETRMVIDTFKATLGIPVRHVWHEDMGFRKSAIMNKALSAIEPSHYVILTDGDLILHKHFIKDHIRLAEPGYYVFGRRVYLSKELTSKVLQKQHYDFKFLQSGIGHRSNMLYLPWLSRITEHYHRNQVYGQGCNLAVWQQDIIRINGFDEQYEGWGYEDTDFICRLRNTGLASKAAKFQAIAYHLWHRQRTVNQANLIALNNTTNNHNKICTNGIKKL